MQNDNLVEIEDVAFGYGARPVLKGINLTAKRGQVVAIMGSSGCGKTTLLRLIGGQIVYHGLLRAGNSGCAYTTHAGE